MHSTRQQSMQLKEYAGHAESATDGAEDGAFKDGGETAEEDMEDVDDPAGLLDAQDDDDNNDDNDDTSISGDQSSEEERRQPQSGGEESSSALSISDNRGRRVRAAQPQKSATGASASSSEQGSSKAVMASAGSHCWPRQPRAWSVSHCCRQGLPSLPLISSPWVLLMRRVSTAQTGPAKSYRHSSRICGVWLRLSAETAFSLRRFGAESDEQSIWMLMASLHRRTFRCRGKRRLVPWPRRQRQFRRKG